MHNSQTDIDLVEKKSPAKASLLGVLGLLEVKAFSYAAEEAFDFFLKNARWIGWLGG